MPSERDKARRLQFSLGALFCVTSVAAYLARVAIAPNDEKAQLAMFVAVAITIGSLGVWLGYVLKVGQ